MWRSPGCRSQTRPFVHRTASTSSQRRASRIRRRGLGGAIDAYFSRNRRRRCQIDWLPTASGGARLTLAGMLDVRDPLLMLIQRLLLMHVLVVENACNPIELRAERFDLAVRLREPSLDGGVHSVEPRVDGIEPRVDGVEPRVDRVEPRVDRVEPRPCAPVGALETSIDPFAEGSDRHTNAAHHSIVPMRG
jgi:hypothetical protein